MRVSGKDLISALSFVSWTFTPSRMTFPRREIICSTTDHWRKIEVITSERFGYYEEASEKSKEGAAKHVELFLFVCLVSF